MLRKRHLKDVAFDSVAGLLEKKSMKKLEEQIDGICKKKEDEEVRIGDKGPTFVEEMAEGYLTHNPR